MVGEGNPTQLLGLLILFFKESVPQYHIKILLSVFLGVYALLNPRTFVGAAGLDWHVPGGWIRGGVPGAQVRHREGAEDHGKAKAMHRIASLVKFTNEIIDAIMGI